MSRGQKTILFDGVCNLCNGFVQFIIKRDRKGTFRFGPLQTEKPQALLRASAHIQPAHLTTVVLLEGDVMSTESDAVLRILRQLPGFWRLLYVFIVVPRPLRDAAYRLIARHRYRIFGRRDVCMVPTPEMMDRFI